MSGQEVNQISCPFTKRSNEMNPWWLLLIVPASAVAGFFVSTLLCMAACTDCKEAMRYRDNLIGKKGFEAGFKEGISKLSEVG
jgi:hypothetical protein